MEESFLTIDHRVDPELRDPICGMVVDETQSVGRRELRNRVYLFCSDACRRQFDTIVGLRTAMGTLEEPPAPTTPAATDQATAVRVAGVAKTYVTHGLKNI